MASLSEHWRPGYKVFVAGLSGESAALHCELREHPQRAAGVEITAVQLPGVDRVDYLAVHPEARVQAFFMTPGVRAGLAQARAALFPLDYTGIARHLLEAPPFDCAIAQFTAPDAGGWCSPGLSADFAPLVWKRALRRVGHVNPILPRIDSSFRVHVSEFHTLVEADAPPLSVGQAQSTAVNQRIGSHAATLVRDGDTLQFGIGAVLPEVAQALHAHRRLRIHSGMMSSMLRTLWESGALDRDARIVTGVLLGDAAFYDFAGRLGRIFLDDVRRTHALGAVAAIPRFVAINSAVEVDLLGQVNSERAAGSLQAGAGGLPAFAQGSQLSNGGRLLICLPSTSRDASVSRIVPALGHDGLCTVPRHQTDAVITEFGVAQLRGRSTLARAEALISIAHPDHRDRLAADWECMLRRL